jgi:hypothetical protein
MKKMIGLALLVLGLSSPAFAKDKNLSAPERIVSSTEVDSDFLKEMIAGAHPDIAVECQEGEAIPIRFAHSFGVFSVKLNPNLTLKVDKTCYLRFVRKKVYISEDLVSWKKLDSYCDGKFGAELVNEGKSGLLLKSHVTPSTEEEED